MYVKAGRGDGSQLVSLLLVSDGGDDSAFLTKLFKMLALCEPIDLPGPKEGQVMTYTNGGEPADLESLSWTKAE